MRTKPEHERKPPDRPAAPRSIRLSDRELEIVLHAAEGLRDKEIAARLGIAMSTLRTYWERLKAKLGAGTRAQAMARALASRHRIAMEELSLAELRASLLIENLTDLAIFFVSPEGIILSWNIGVARVLGYSEDEFVGKHLDIIFSSGDVEAGIELIERQTAVELGRASDERWHIRKDGARIWVSGTLVAISDGRLRCFAKIMRDDTRTKQLEQELEHLRAILNSKN